MRFDPCEIFLRTPIKSWVNTDDVTPLGMELPGENEERSDYELEEMSDEDLSEHSQSSTDSCAVRGCS